MLNFSNIAMTAKLFHSTNIDEWMEACAEEAAAKRLPVKPKSQTAPLN